MATRNVSRSSPILRATWNSPMSEPSGRRASGTDLEEGDVVVVVPVDRNTIGPLPKSIRATSMRPSASRVEAERTARRR